jgi:hypothetical protein
MENVWIEATKHTIIVEKDVVIENVISEIIARLFLRKLLRRQRGNREETDQESAEKA